MAKTKKPELKSIDFEAYVEDNKDNLTRAELHDLNKMKTLIESGNYGVEFNPMSASYNLVDKEGNIYNKQTGLKTEGDILRRTFGGEKKRISGLMGDIYSNKKYLKGFSTQDSEDSSKKDTEPQINKDITEKETKPELPNVKNNNNIESTKDLDEQSKIKTIFSNYSSKDKIPEFTGLQQSKQIQNKKPVLFTTEDNNLNSKPNSYSWSDFGTDTAKALVRSSDTFAPLLGTSTNLIYDVLTSNKASEILNKKDEVPQTPVISSPIGGYSKEEQERIASGLKQQDKSKPAIVSPSALVATGAATAGGGTALYYGGKYVKNIPSKIYNWFNSRFNVPKENIKAEEKVEEVVKPTIKPSKVIPKAEQQISKAAKRAKQIEETVANLSKAGKAARTTKKIIKAVD